MISKEEIYDVTEWDCVNWGKAIKLLDSLNLPIKGKKVLELGSRNGGMSLFFARRGVLHLYGFDNSGRRCERKT